MRAIWTILLLELIFFATGSSQTTTCIPVLTSSWSPSSTSDELSLSTKTVTIGSSPTDGTSGGTASSTDSVSSGSSSTAGSSLDTTTEAGTSSRDSTSTSITISTSESPSVSPYSTTILSPSTTSAECQNGGTFDGNKCICQDSFYGSLCESIIERVEFGETVDVSVTVTLSFPNRPFTPDLDDKTTVEYKNFAKDFKDQMALVYADVPEYSDVEITGVRAIEGGIVKYEDFGKKINDEMNVVNAKISRDEDVIPLSARSGGIIVDHIIILLVEYKAGSNLNVSYEELFERVDGLLNSMAKNCTTDDTSEFCFTDEIVTEQIPLPSDLERCLARIPDGFEDFYTTVLTSEGLSCVSHCEPTSKKYFDCNKGKCEIQKTTGPVCFCSDTDTYIYTGPRCTSPILKAGVYGGVGAAIAILVIIVAVVGVFLYRSHHKKEIPTLINDKDKWYDDTEDEWSVQKGFSNVSEDFNEGETDGQYHDTTNTTPIIQPEKEAFKPNLESVDTSIEVKIQRPVVSYA
ncbi:mucin-17-like isoform X3 [Phyllobates terribilis]|uniref:mucin-17-like isoform X3 n=1 Tax=Phyllobates terribilis TaxID=111132 RepID=UPI003CCACE53